MCHVREKYRPLLGGCPPSYSSYPRLSMEYIAVLAPSDNHCKIDTSSNNMITWWLVINLPCRWTKKNTKSPNSPNPRNSQPSVQFLQFKILNFYRFRPQFYVGRPETKPVGFLSGVRSKRRAKRLVQLQGWKIKDRWRWNLGFSWRQLVNHGRAKFDGFKT